ncbi:hypothetical protein QUF70_04200 [Desulfobacterales bacterium HSG17]|nr:hypothetical protein [Desulfobacterales bacterium HSG17]
MSGKIKEMIDSILSTRSKGNPVVAKALETKFILKGINPNEYSSASEDDPDVIQKLENLAKQLGVSL